MLAPQLTSLPYSLDSSYTSTCAQEARRGSREALESDHAVFSPRHHLREVLPEGQQLQTCSSIICSAGGRHVCTLKGRTKTFCSWSDLATSSFSPIDLAEQGLYYAEEGRCVRCVGCKLVIERFKSKDVPLKIHAEQHPYCSFVGGSGTSQSSREPTNGHNNSANNHVQQDGQTSRPSSGNSSRTLESDALGIVIEDPSPSEHVSPPSNSSRKENLRRENELLKQSGTCQKCKKEKIQTLFLPCRHLLTCEKCADAMERCLKCEAAILGTVRTYFG